MKNLRLLTLAAAAGLGLVACSIAGLPLAGDPTPLPTVPPGTATLPDPTVTVDFEPTDVAPTPDELMALPAPLYFIGSVDEQIWRLERDGVSLTQITRELQPVTGFDVSTVDGSLLYVSGNDLFRADALGNGRTVVIDGQDFPPDNYDARINIEITNPRWSPEGAQIAIGLGGLTLLPAEGGEGQLVVASDEVPTLSADPQPHPLAKFYRPFSWSPDGARVLVQFYYWPEGIGWGIYSLADGSFVEITSPDGPCCAPTWTPDSQHVYFSNDTFGMVRAGLWRAPAADGVAATLIAGTLDEQTFTLVRDARLLADGKLYFFFAVTEGYPEGNSALRMVRADPDGVSAHEQLRSDEYVIVETLWDAGGKGAIIATLPEVISGWPPRGPLTWLPTDGSPAVSLPAQGYQLIWGK